MAIFKLIDADMSGSISKLELIGAVYRHALVASFVLQGHGVEQMQATELLIFIFNAFSMHFESCSIHFHGIFMTFSWFLHGFCMVV